MKGLAIGLIFPFVFFLPGAHAADSRPTADFNRDVAPILSDRCFQCHGPDSAKRKAKLRLDTADGLFGDRGGYKAVEPGKPDASEMIKRITSVDADETMPPAKAGPRLTAAEIDAIRRWIAAGAEYRGHWAFIRPTRPAAPTFSDAKQIAWIRNPIDSFILARLTKEVLAPSPPADKARLLRRLSQDLNGLPPTPEEVDAFVNDTSQNAYEKQVDRLLASPRYGERMALPWLDAARYADTHGYQKDNVREMWAWRDWVIGAFNQNMPFDRFTIDQIAGDMLPNATMDEKIASGFNRNHRINAEGGSIPEEFRVEYVIDRVDTTSTVWLGLTAGCARCHDHRFDPIPQKDFYSLFAYFNNVPEKGVDGGKGNAAPVLIVPIPGAAEKIAVAQKRVAEWEKQLAVDTPARRQAFDRWMTGAVAAARTNLTDMWVVAKPDDAEATGGIKFKTLPDKSLLVVKGNPDVSTYTIELKPGTRRLTGLRLEVLADTSLSGGGPGLANGNFVLSGITVMYKRPDMNEAEEVEIASAIADYSNPKWPIAGAIDDKPETGWAIHGEPKPWNRKAVFTFKQPLASDGDTAVTVVLRHQAKARPKHLIGRFRLSLTSAAEPALDGQGEFSAELIAALQTGPAQRTPEQLKRIQERFLKSAPEFAAVRKGLADAKKELATRKKKATTSVMVMKEMDKPRQAHVLKRGLYDQPGDPVQPGIPAALGHLPAGAPNNRLGFAQWLVDADNPLTARVTVNRLWQMIFGVGLVKTAEDFGNQGEMPSHPELLDWLAVEFRESGWDTKHMLKLMVMSETYRQSSRTTPELVEKDPANRLLAHGPRVRLSGEAVRDQALFAAGLLVEKIGGPPVKPYQPAGLWKQVAGINSDTVDYIPDHGDGLHRRSLYTFWKRAVAPPSLTIFDAASREACNVRPRVTNTPLQALTAMNDVQFVEASRGMAERMLKHSADDAQRLSYGWRLVLARAPSEVELKTLLAGLQKHRQRFKADAAAAKELIHAGETAPDAKLDPAELAAFTAIANTILNLDEAVTKE